MLFTFSNLNYAGVANHLKIEFSTSPIFQGESINVTIKALDSSESIDLNYNGSVALNVEGGYFSPSVLLITNGIVSGNIVCNVEGESLLVNAQSGGLIGSIGIQSIPTIMPHRKGKFALWYSSGYSSDSLAVMTNFHYVVPGDPLPQSQIDIFHNHGCKLFLYYWQPAVYSHSSPLNLAGYVLSQGWAPWGDGGWLNAGSHIWDMGNPAVRTWRVHNNVSYDFTNTWAHLDYDGTFYDSTTIEFPEGSAPRVGWDTKYPALTWMEACNLYFQESKTTYPDKLICCNGAFNTSSLGAYSNFKNPGYWPNIDLDIWESAIMKWDNKTYPINVDGFGNISVRECQYINWYGDYGAEKLFQIMQDKADKYNSNMILTLFNYIPPGFKEIGSSGVYKIVPNKEAIYYGLAMAYLWDNLWSWSYEELPNDSPYRVPPEQMYDDIYTFDLGSVCSPAYEDHGTIKIRYYENGFVCVGILSNQNNIADISSSYLRTDINGIYDCFSKTFVTNLQSTKLITLTPYQSPISGKHFPRARIYMYVRNTLDIGYNDLGVSQNILYLTNYASRVATNFFVCRNNGSFSVSNIIFSIGSLTNQITHTSLSSNFVSFTPNGFNLDSNRLCTNKISISIPSGTAEGDYSAKLFVFGNNASVSDSITVMLHIKPEEDLKILSDSLGVSNNIMKMIAFEGNAKTNLFSFQHTAIKTITNLLVSASEFTDQFGYTLSSNIVSFSPPNYFSLSPGEIKTNQLTVLPPIGATAGIFYSTIKVFDDDLAPVDSFVLRLIVQSSNESIDILDNALNVSNAVIAFTNESKTYNTNSFIVKDDGGFNILNVQMFVSDITNYDSGLIFPSHTYVNLVYTNWDVLYVGEAKTNKMIIRIPAGAPLGKYVGHLTATDKEDGYPIDSVKIEFWVTNSGTVYYVKPTGSDSNDGLSWTTAFKTLQIAWSNVQPGDSVYVTNGTYTENLKGMNYGGSVDNPISFTAFGNDVKIIDPGNSGVYGAFDFFNCGNLDFFGFKFMGGPTGIYCENSSNISIEHCVFSNNTSIHGNLNLQSKNKFISVRDSEFGNCNTVGLQHIDGDNLLIDSCTFYVNPNVKMIYMDGLDLNTIIRNNEIIGSGGNFGDPDSWGIWLGGNSSGTNSNILIEHNTIHELRAGIELILAANGVSIKSNNLYNNNIAIDVQQSSKNVNIVFNNIHNNVRNAIALTTSISNTYIAFNTITHTSGEGAVKASVNIKDTYFIGNTVCSNVPTGNNPCIDFNNTIRNLYILNNHIFANSKHGIHLNQDVDNVYLQRNIINNNGTDSSQYGLYVEGGTSNLFIDNCTFYANGNKNPFNKAVEISGGVHTIHNTITRKNADGFGGDDGIVLVGGATASITYSDIEDGVSGGVLGTQCIITNPKFHNDLFYPYDLRLRFYSGLQMKSETNSVATAIGGFATYTGMDNYLAIMGQVSTYTLVFQTLKAKGAIPSDGKIEIEFPDNVDITGINNIQTSSSWGGTPGTFSFNLSGQKLIIIRNNDGTTTVGGQNENFILSGLQNLKWGIYHLNYKIYDGNGQLLDKFLSNDFRIGDFSAFILTNMSPIQNSTNVEDITTITNFFSNPIDSTTVQSDTLQVYNSALQKVSGTVSVMSNQLIFVPSTNLEPNELYIVKLKTLLYDVWGQNLDADEAEIEWHFQTGVGIETPHIYNPIVIDGIFSDWNATNAVRYTGEGELLGTDGDTGTEIDQVWTTWDKDNIYFRITTGGSAISGEYDMLLDVTRDERGATNWGIGYDISFSNYRKPEYQIATFDNFYRVFITNSLSSWTKIYEVGAGYLSQNSDSREFKIPWSVFSNFNIPNRISLSVRQYASPNDYFPENPNNWITFDPDNNGDDVPDGHNPPATTVQILNFVTIQTSLGTIETNHPVNTNLSFLLPGTTITFKMSYTNSGLSSASNIRISYKIPPNLTYLSNSLKMGNSDSDYYAGYLVTDAEGDDEACYSNNYLVFTPAGISPNNPNILPSHSSGSISFRAIVNNLSYSSEITNTINITGSDFADAQSNYILIVDRLRSGRFSFISNATMLAQDTTKWFSGTLTNLGNSTQNFSIVCTNIIPSISSHTNWTLRIYDYFTGQPKGFFVDVAPGEWINFRIKVENLQDSLTSGETVEFNVKAIPLLSGNDYYYTGDNNVVYGGDLGKNPVGVINSNYYGMIVQQSNSPPTAKIRLTVTNVFHNLKVNFLPITNISLQGIPVNKIKPGTTISVGIVYSNITGHLVENSYLYSRIPNFATYSTQGGGSAVDWIVEWSTNLNPVQTYNSLNYTTARPPKDKIRWIRWRKHILGPIDSNKTLQYKIIVK